MKILDEKAIADINKEADELIIECLFETHSIDRNKMVRVLTQYKNIALNIQERVINEN